MFTIFLLHNIVHIYNSEDDALTGKWVIWIDGKNVIESPPRNKKKTRYQSELIQFYESMNEQKRFLLFLIEWSWTTASTYGSI
jgi:hypothetical protein